MTLESIYGRVYHRHLYIRLWESNHAVYCYP